jgi:hypothetical protein
MSAAPSLWTAATRWLVYLLLILAMHVITLRLALRRRVCVVKVDLVNMTLASVVMYTMNSESIQVRILTLIVCMLFYEILMLLMFLTGFIIIICVSIFRPAVLHVLILNLILYTQFC